MSEALIPKFRLKTANLTHRKPKLGEVMNFPIRFQQRCRHLPALHGCPPGPCL